MMIYDNVFSWVSQNIDCDTQSTIFTFGTSGIPSLLFELKSNLEKKGHEVVISLIVFPSTHARLEVKKCIKNIVECKNEIVNNNDLNHIEKTDQCLPIHKKYTKTIKKYYGMMIYDNVLYWVLENIDYDIQSNIFTFETYGIPLILFDLKSDLENNGHEVKLSHIDSHARLEVKKCIKNM